MIFCEYPELGNFSLLFNYLSLYGRQKSSGAEGERLKEATNINKSLSTLGYISCTISLLVSFFFWLGKFPELFYFILYIFYLP